MPVVVWFLACMVGLLLAVSGWGLWRVTGKRAERSGSGRRDGLLVALLLLTGLGTGIFVLYVLLGLGR